MADFPQVQAPALRLSEDAKEKMRKVDTARPYLHRAAMFALPAMAGANYLTPLRHANRKHHIVAGIGAAGAGLGLLDRKIEQLAEEHAELRPTLKNYAKHTGASMTDSSKLGSVAARVQRNQNELAAAFPMTMAQHVELQKEALMLDPKTTAKATGQAFKFMKGPAPALIGAGVGAAGGALADGENRGRGALVGGLAGAALGGGATGLTHMYGKEISTGLRKANTFAAKGTTTPGSPSGTPVSADSWLKKFREGAANPQTGLDLATDAKKAEKAAEKAAKKAAEKAKKATDTAAKTPQPTPPVGETPVIPPGEQPGVSEQKALVSSAPASSLRVKLHHMTSKEGSAGSVSKVNEIINEVNGATPYIIGAGALGGGAYAGYLTHKQNKKNEKKGMQKRAGMNTMSDAHRAIGGRPPYALLTMGGETSNDAVINQMLRALFANTDAMRKATEDQVLAAFPLSAPFSYGRHRAIGRTAEDIKAEIALAYTPTQR